MEQGISIWQADTPAHGHPELTERIRCDAAVIGGGLAGILTAKLLSREGADCVVLERSGVGCGETGRTTAMQTRGDVALGGNFGFELDLSQLSDADAETGAYVRGLLDRAGVVWQIAELGKVDAGGGGTVAMYMANRTIATLDAGVPVLSMHAPFETVSKLDCYMTYKGCTAVYEAE